MSILLLHFFIEWRIEAQNPGTSKIILLANESLQQRIGTPFATYFTDESYKSIWKRLESDILDVEFKFILLVFLLHISYMF